MTDGEHSLTWGDLWGAFKLDPVVGYVYEENFTSQNRWWRSNNVGARADRDASAMVPSGQKRVLVFGESYGHGSRVRQEQAWPSVLGAEHPELEVLNLAVDGYSMAQAFLRYREIRKTLRYDIAVLMFVPEADLWRDVNTFRQLYEPSWESPLIPRFSLSNGDLHLIPAFYEDPLDLYRKNGDGLSAELRRHLRANDRFYFSSAYDEPRGLGRSIWWRLVSSAQYVHERRALEQDLMSPAGEALQVTRTIIEAMQQEVLADGASFAVAVLPTKSMWWNGSWTPADLQQWQHLIYFLCANQKMCIDLLPALQTVAAGDVDRVYDGEHFGPGMNARIAAATYRALARESTPSNRR